MKFIPYGVYTSLNLKVLEGCVSVNIPLDICAHNTKSIEQLLTKSIDLQYIERIANIFTILKIPGQLVAKFLRWMQSSGRATYPTLWYSEPVKLHVVIRLKIAWRLGGLWNCFTTQIIEVN